MWARSFYHISDLMSRIFEWRWVCRWIGGWEVGRRGSVGRPHGSVGRPHGVAPTEAVLQARTGCSSVGGWGSADWGPPRALVGRLGSAWSMGRRAVVCLERGRGVWSGWSVKKAPGSSGTRGKIGKVCPYGAQRSKAGRCLVCDACCREVKTRIRSGLSVRSNNWS
jgi:hypothetical protein